MKKIFAIALAAVLFVGCFASCGKSSDNTLTMATNAEFPPYEYKEDGKVVGIDAEIGKAIADKLGMEFEIKDIKFDSIVTGVQSGKYDMGMAGMTVTEDRKKSVSFTDSYATGVQAIIVNNDSEIKEADDLFKKGSTHKIGVQTGTTGDLYTTDDIEKAKLGTVTRYNSGADAVQALIAGKIDCVVIDNEPAKSYVKANEGIKILDTKYAEEDYAICVAKDNTELKDKINTALKELVKDGTVKKIIDKYISAE